MSLQGEHFIRTVERLTKDYITSLSRYSLSNSLWTPDGTYQLKSRILSHMDLLGGIKGKEGFGVLRQNLENDLWKSRTALLRYVALNRSE